MGENKSAKEGSNASPWSLKESSFADTSHPRNEREAPRRKGGQIRAKQCKMKQEKSTSQPSQPKPQKAPTQLPTFQNETFPGQKKLLQSFDSPHFQAYSPKAVEAAWYTWWEKSGFFPTAVS